MIGLGHIGITKQRAEIAEYLDTWFDAAEFVMTSSKPKEVSSILTILRPFGPIVWVLVAATIVLILTILLTNDAVHLPWTHMGEAAIKGSFIYTYTFETNASSTSTSILSIRFHHVHGTHYKSKFASPLDSNSTQKWGKGCFRIDLSPLWALDWTLLLIPAPIISCCQEL